MPDRLSVIAQRCLAGSGGDDSLLLEELRLHRSQLSGEALILGTLLRRLITVFSRVRQGQITLAQDGVILLRQWIRAQGVASLHRSLWLLLQKDAERSLLFASPSDGETVDVIARPWHSDFLPHSEEIDRLRPLALVEPEPGDGMLAAMSEATSLPWTHYRSSAQKAAVDAWLFAPPGSTTLVTLPTGGGKSLCTVLPAWFATRGGRHTRGTTLVVVPTVALAMDQEKQASRFFADAVGELSKPISRTGDTSEQERIAIESALRDGRLPIIFTSPESLLDSRLHDVCLDAAGRGLITRLIVDEAHLVATWGVGFRPEFQQLAAYRRRLLEKSGGRLRTLLLSATISERSRDTLEMLFSEPGALVVVQANRLRPEVGYWFNISHRQATRRARVLEALRILPRPLILYVTRPSQAKEWLAVLGKDGYQRVRAFSGDTSDDERRSLIRAWDNDEIDIMVATSAFGLGVDKSNVRAIVHATVPENLDRFYQEVGRGGRDGFSATSLLCAYFNQEDESDDIKLVYSLQSRLITRQKALPRLQSMFRTSVSDGNIRWIDRDVTPLGRHSMMPSERNRDWNDHILLMLNRARFIEIVDAPPAAIGDGGTRVRRLPIRVIESSVFNDPAGALDDLEAQRKEEVADGQEAARAVIDLVRHFAASPTHEPPGDCISARFAGLYAEAQPACGGCPACRARGEEPWCPPLAFTIEMPHALRRTVAADAVIEPKLERRLGAWRTLNVTWQDPAGVRAMEAVRALMPMLVRNGFQQIIYADEVLADQDKANALIRALAQPGAQRLPLPHRLLPESWITGAEYPLFALATIVIYPQDDRRADMIFRALGQAQKGGVRFPGLINFLPEGLVLAGQGKRFLEHVNGLTEPIERFQSLMATSDEEPTFF